MSSEAYSKGLLNIRGKVSAVKADRMLSRMKSMARPAVRKAMGKAVAYWHGQLLPRIPVRGSVSMQQRRMGRKGPLYSNVGRGMLKKRTQPFVKDGPKGIRGGFSFATDYAIWLIAGTRRIAKGRVMRWREGERPITDWPAKAAGGNPRGEMPVALPTRQKGVKFLIAELRKIKWDDEKK